MSRIGKGLISKFKEKFIINNSPHGKGNPESSRIELSFFSADIYYILYMTYLHISISLYLHIDMEIVSTNQIES